MAGPKKMKDLHLLLVAILESIKTQLLQKHISQFFFNSGLVAGHSLLPPPHPQVKTFISFIR